MIQKEKTTVLIAFQIINEDEPLPVGYKKIGYYLVFDVKHDLTRKARLVAERYRNKDVAPHMPYSSVVSREGVRIGFLIAALNDLDVLACDIGNAYLNAPNIEKVYVTYKSDLFHSEDVGKNAIVVCALYGQKTCGAAWRTHFANVIRTELGYK